MESFQKFNVNAPAGVNFTREPSQMDSRLWDQAQNVTFRHGKTFKCSGFEEGLGTALTTPQLILPVRDDDSNFYNWTYAGMQKERKEDGTITETEKAYVILSKGVHADATPENGFPILDSSLRKYEWTGDSLNGVPYITRDKPYQYDYEAKRYKPLEDFPEHVHFSNMRTFRNYMIGLNFSTDSFTAPTNPEDKWYGFGSWSQGDHQDGIWWSNNIVGKNLANDISEPASGAKRKRSFWCDAEPTRDSGWNILGGTGGPIVDGKPMRDSFIIYRERAIWQMVYCGGINVFTFKELFNDAGALGKNCVAEIEGQHLVVGQSDVYMHNGVQKRSVADGVVRKELFRSIDPNHNDKVFIAVSYKDKEAWICIPEASTNVDGNCNVAFVYNWEENHWSKRFIPDLTCSAYTILSIPEDDVTWVAPEEGGPNHLAIEGSTWAETSDTWLDSFFKYSAAEWGLALGSGRVIPAGEADTYKWQDAEGWVDGKVWDEGRSDDKPKYFIFTSLNDPMFNGANIEAYVARTHLDLGDRSDTKFMAKLYPLVRKGIVDVYVDGTYNVDDGINWKKVQTFDPTRDSKISTRVSGRYLHLKFVIPKNSRAELRGYDFDFNVIGRRG